VLVSLKSSSIVKFYKSFCLIAFAAIILLSGCSQNSSLGFNETEDKNYRRGKHFYQDGRYRESLASFLKVIEHHHISPESHLEAGRIYLEHIQDPISAIYHFRKYLEFKPNAEQSPIVRQMIETGQREFVKSFPGPSVLGQDKRLDLLELLQQVREENIDLKKQLAAAKRQLSNPASFAQKETQQKPKENIFTPKPEKKALQIKQQKLYTVDYGDTLSTISTKVYGTSARWHEIFEENQDTLSSPHSLRVGQILRVP